MLTIYAKSFMTATRAAKGRAAPVSRPEPLPRLRAPGKERA
ncbi:hypothetical protein [Pseudooceanicola sp. HF7]|nr:hypothetical protein [Pseudooceanicola sp. HF7]